MLTISEEKEEEKKMEEKIDEVLDRLRPFLAREGGDIQLDHFDVETSICYVKMLGACNGCYMAESDVSDSVEVLLMDEIPEIKKVVLVQPEQPSLNDLLERLKQEEQANNELQEINRKRKEEGQSEQKEP